MRRILTALSLLLVFSAGSFGQEIPVTDDEKFFTEALDLNYRGLEKVKADVQCKDYSSARRDFVSYLKSRQRPFWYFDWRKRTDPDSRNLEADIEAADKYASNLLVSCGVWYQFGDTVDWSINPTELKYNEWTWQLSRHPFWIVLGQAYWATGDEKYAEAFVRQMRSWVLQNPLPDYPANNAGSRWRTIETGIRMSTSWPEAFFRFLSSPSFDDDSIILMVKSFYEHGLHLRAYPQRNNWLTMEMNGLFHVGILFPEFKQSKEWCRYASSRLHEESINQFYPDGAQKELTCGYHGVSLKNMLGLYSVGKLNGYPLPEDYCRRMENAYMYYVKVGMPDLCVPALNDSGWGNMTVRDRLAEVSAIFPDQPLFKYFASEGSEGAAPEFTSVWMPWAGWAIMRSGWGPDDLYSIMEVGPLGEAHSHEDKLSIILSAYGRRLLTEGGTYAYDTSAWRKYILSARAHNVSRVDGRDQARLINHRGRYRTSYEPLPNRWVSNGTADFAEGWYNEGFGRDRDSTVTQYRALTFIKKHSLWLLLDVFTPSDDKEHSYDTWFHLNTSECGPTSCGGFASEDAGVANLAIIPLRKDAPAGRIVMGQKEPEVQGWVPKGGTTVYDCVPVATPTFSRKAAGRCVEPYVLCPSRPGESVRVVKVKEKSEGCYVIRLSDRSKVRIGFELGGNSLKSLAIDGEELLK